MPLLRKEIEKIISEEMAGSTLHTMEELADIMIKLSSRGDEDATFTQSLPDAPDHLYPITDELRSFPRSGPITCPLQC